MEERIIPVGKISADQIQGMDAHYRLAADGTRHFDGWTCYVAAERRDQLLLQLAHYGFFWLLVEEGGLVQWQFRVSHALFFDDDAAVLFADPAHRTAPYPAHTLVVYGGARRETIKRERLRRLDGEPFRPQARGGRHFAYVLFEPWMNDW